MKNSVAAFPTESAETFSREAKDESGDDSSPEKSYGRLCQSCFFGDGIEIEGIEGGTYSWTSLGDQTELLFSRDGIGEFSLCDRPLDFISASFGSSLESGSDVFGDGGDAFTCRGCDGDTKERGIGIWQQE